MPQCPARFDLCGGLARFLFSANPLENLQTLIRESASQFDPAALTKPVQKQVKKVRSGSVFRSVLMFLSFQFDTPAGAGALVVFDPGEDIHTYSSPKFVSPYVKFLLASSAFVNIQSSVQQFLQDDVLRPQSISLLASELFEYFAILQLSHKGNVQVIFLFCFSSRFIFFVLLSGLSSQQKFESQSHIPTIRVCFVSSYSC